MIKDLKKARAELHVDICKARAELHVEHLKQRKQKCKALEVRGYLICSRNCMEAGTAGAE